MDGVQARGIWCVESCQSSCPEDGEREGASRLQRGAAKERGLLTAKNHDGESSEPAWREIHRAFMGQRRCLHRSTTVTASSPRLGWGNGRCCGSGWSGSLLQFGHVRVTSRHERNLVTEPYLIGDAPRSKPVTLVFWSGGKDAYLALLEHLLEKHIHGLCVLVTVSRFLLKPMRSLIRMFILM